jgi:hypothetical protein
VARILLVWNNPVFQESLFSLEREEALAALATLKKIHHMEWDQLNRNRGLRWEAILSRTGPAGQRIYSLRVTGKVWAVAWRQRNFLRLLSLHPDRDSAYE